MKWKLHGNLYWVSQFKSISPPTLNVWQCTTPSVLGVIATLDPRRGNRPPKLTVYEDLPDEHNPHKPVYGGVSVLLLDYLVVTALLLVTDLQEWALVPSSHSKSSRSEQVEFDSGNADSPMWKERALRPMGTHGLETSNEASTSMPSAVLTGPPSVNPPAVQASPSHVHNPPWPHSFVDTDSDYEDEHESQRRRSPSLQSPAIESEFSHLLHQHASPSRRSAVSSGPKFPASDHIRNLVPQSIHGSKRSLSIRSSVIADDIEGEVLPSVLQIIHPFQGMELERKQNPYNHQTSEANSARNPRPLPLPPVAYSPDKSSPGSSPSSLPSQHRSGRILPSIPYTSHHPHRSSDLLDHSVHPTLLEDHDPSSQFSQHQTITKTSREGITHWLNSLTGDSPTTENALELLISASIYDAPPPAYNSLGFPLEQRVSSSDPTEEMSSECQR
jgi:hypothetical protein